MLATLGAFAAMSPVIGIAIAGAVVGAKHNRKFDHERKAPR